jgi:Tol biopolymer transport system component
MDNIESRITKRFFELVSQGELILERLNEHVWVVPRKITRSYTVSAVVAAAMLTVLLAPCAAFVPRAGAATGPEQSDVRFGFSAGFYRVSEGDGGATITVVRSGNTGSEVSVEYLADGINLNASGCIYLAEIGSATPGVDYARASGTLRFAAGETSKTFSVSVTDDAEIESRQPETVFLSLDFSPERPPSDAICYGAAAMLLIHDNDPAPSPTPTPSPSNKRKIAFGSNRDGNDEIYVMDEDGTGVRRLTNTLAYDGQPSWSPDGTRLTFISDRDGRNGIYLMNSDGSNVNKLANLAGEDPVWSPNSARIAFTSGSDIYVVNIDGGAPLNVTHDPQEDFGPAWSPDGNRLAFTSRRDNGTFSVYVVNIDGTGIRRVVEGYSRDPAWSPDGTRIAYGAQGEQLGLNIYLVNADGTGKKFLSGDRAFTYDVSPAWSPDSARIAFASNRDGNFEIYVMNADGTGQTRLTTDGAHDSSPVWQPQANAPPPSAPVLLTEPNTAWAVALDSVTQVAAPFGGLSSSNFSADGRTRVSLFAAGVISPSVDVISVEAEDSAGRRYQLPVEHVAPVAGLDGIIQVIVRLPDGLDGLNYVWVNLNVRGTPTNKAVLHIQNNQ